MLKTIRLRTLFTLAVGAAFLLFLGADVSAFDVLGTGTASLIGNDLTDLGDDGDPETDNGYDAIFDANHEPGFGSLNQDPASAGAGESAFNVFDNRLGPGNDKWCCGRPGGIFEDDPMWVSAQLPVRHFLTNFTVSSANDVEGRDPIHWAVQGSNDGTNYSDIYVYQDDFGPWTERLQVIEFKEVDDFPVQTTSYQYFRLATYDTINNQNADPAYFQIGEIEFFGRPDGVVPPLFVGGEGIVGTNSFEGDQSNEVLGAEQPGVPGWSGRIVTFDEHQTTLDNHTAAEDALANFPGVTAPGAYPVVDMAGGAGTFTENLEYPNGVADENQNDFAVQVLADVVIPVGTWTIGFGSDDGGRLHIPGVQFTDSMNNDNFQDDEIRFEGNRGHGWTVGAFEVTGEPLTTTITASFHERGGGDSFEVAVTDGTAIEAANPAGGWQLLADGTLGWSVTTTTRPLVSADLTAVVSDARPWQFDVNGDSNTADQFVVTNPDPNVFTTILNVDGVTFNIKSTGAVASGDSFDIINADQIVGTPIITSVTAGQNWVFDAARGLICLNTCPGVVSGDYNNDGVINVADIEILRTAVQNGNNSFDLTGDNVANSDDIKFYAESPTLLNSWIGDSNGDGEFNSADFVAVFVAGQYEDGVPTNSTWATGDWNGDGEFDSSDFVFAFIGGGYEMGARPAINAVPEPSGVTLSLLSLVGLIGMRRRRTVR